MPFKQYESDAGWDLFVSKDVDIPPHSSVDVHTSIKIKIPYFMYGRITGRSSTLRKHKLLVNEGIIDSGYVGELHSLVMNLSDEVFHVKQGMRLAQLIFAEVPRIEFNQVRFIIDDGSQTRGDHGFGSTGE